MPYFSLSCIVMTAGFAVMVWGVWKAIELKSFSLGALTASAGVLTQLIGGTFLLVYRSSIGQAIKYTLTLERMNSVGMAMQILDTMQDQSDKDLVNKTKADLVKLLIQQVGK